MTSEKQIAANRANAQRSTGPKTEVGKVRSRRNAWKHGLTAQAITIAGEDPHDFEILRQQLWDDYQPVPGMECVLVDRLAEQTWRLRRAPVFEAALIEAQCAEVDHDPIAAPFGVAKDEGNIRLALALIRDSRHYDTLGKLSRHEAALLNASHRTLQQLLFLQDRRRGEEERTQTVEAISLPTSDRDAA
jgi:hypothetical protein